MLVIIFHMRTFFNTSFGDHKWEPFQCPTMVDHKHEPFSMPNKCFALGTPAAEDF